MKNSILIIAVSGLFFVQCSLAQNKAQTAKVPDALSEVYVSYINLKNALTKDNADSASAYAKFLFNSVDNVKTDKLSTVQYEAWIKNMKDISYNAEHIKATDDIEHQREHFIKLSSAVYNVIKEFKSNPDNVYYQFCPMADNGKGAYWISENPKVVNPYYGKKMLNCGSTKETLKGN